MGVPKVGSLHMSLGHWPLMKNLYWCSPGSRSTVTAQDPSSFCMGVSPQLLKEPRRLTERTSRPEGGV